MKTHTSSAEILKKCIEKAEKNGFKFSETDGWCGCKNMQFGVIFSHDFAKAFFGSAPMNEDDVEWRVRLTEMVLEEDPILYLAKFI